MTSIIRFTFVVSFLVTMVTACGGGVSEPSNNIDASLNGQWAIAGFLAGDGEFKTPLPSSAPFAKFSSEGMTGTTGCNSFFATVDALPDGSWASSQIGMTAMGCQPELTAQEQAITNAIASATLWSAEEDTAQLSAAGIVLMTMERWMVDLTTADWVVTGINNGKGAVVSVLAGSEPRITFGTDDRVAATAGCNDLFGSYIAGDSALTIGRLSATEKFCQTPDGVMQQEQQMLEALASAASYTIDGNRLTVRDADGATQITAIPTDQ